jgi:hypothetical protein
MNLTTTGILELLGEQAGRYIQHDMGDYRIKEASGTDVTVRENGQDVPIRPTAQQMDDLMEASLLIRDGPRILRATDRRPL